MSGNKEELVILDSNEYRRMHESDIVNWMKTRAFKNSQLRYLASMQEYRQINQI